MIYLTYATTEICLIVCALLILTRINGNLDSEDTVHEMRNIVYAFIITLITDMLWALTEGGYIATPRVVNAFINAISLSAVIMGCFYWFCFVNHRLKTGYMSSKKQRRLVEIPALIAVAINFVSVFTKWTFSIDEGGHYMTGKAFFIQVGVCYLYLLIPTILSIIGAFKTKNKRHRTEYILYAVYMLPALISGFLEDYLPEIPLLYLSTYIVINYLFITILDRQISKDAMTGLNNGRSFDDYLEKVVGEASEKKPVTIFMMDVNGFKQINDTYGHVVGDDILKLVAQVLGNVASKYGMFACRYGGDELSFVKSKNQSDENEIIEAVREELKAAQKTSARGFKVTISIGYATCKMKDYDIKELIALADGYLYKDKQRHKNELGL